MLRSCFVTIVAIIAYLVLPSSGQGPIPKSTYFYLTRSWSPSFCLFDSSADRQGACKNATDRFTIHGLWLTCSNGGWPNERDCPGEPYDPAALAELVPVLNKQWPSYGDKGNENFWDHEWTCHGICAGIGSDKLSNQAAFFQEVLQLDTANTLNVLAQQLQLDTELSTADVVNQAAGLIGAAPVVTCYYRHGKAYLSSVMSCVANDLSLENCQPSDESCDSETLTIPSLKTLAAAEPCHAGQSQPRSVLTRPAQRALLRSDPRGCAISQQKCSLRGLDA